MGPRSDCAASTRGRVSSRREVATSHIPARAENVAPRRPRIQMFTADVVLRFEEAPD
jgi:hypothetical protein